MLGTNSQLLKNIVTHKQDIHLNLVATEHRHIASCTVLNPVKRFEIHLVLNLGSKKWQIIIVSLEGGLGVSFQQSQGASPLKSSSLTLT